MPTNVVFAGVGGQGVLLSCRLLLQAAQDEGHDVKGSEVHGMAQRGGSVDGHVRFGHDVASPVIRAGSASYLVCFELLEAARALPCLAAGGTLLCAEIRIDPAPVAAGEADYPGEVAAWLSGAVEHALILDARTALRESGIPLRCVNVFMLGALSAHLDFAEPTWERAMRALVKPRHIEPNLQAFALGRDAAVREIAQHARSGG